MKTIILFITGNVIIDWIIVVLSVSLTQYGDPPDKRKLSKCSMAGREYWKFPPY